MDHLFDTAKAIASATWTMDQNRPPLREVWILWHGYTVLGVYSTEAQAQAEQALLMLSTRIEKRRVG